VVQMMTLLMVSLCIFHELLDIIGHWMAFFWGNLGFYADRKGCLLGRRRRNDNLHILIKIRARYVVGDGVVVLFLFSIPKVLFFSLLAIALDERPCLMLLLSMPPW
jgi:hypothetical protein